MNNNSSSDTGNETGNNKKSNDNNSDEWNNKGVMLGILQHENRTQLSWTSTPARKNFEVVTMYPHKLIYNKSNSDNTTSSKCYFNCEGGYCFQNKQKK